MHISEKLGGSKPLKFSARITLALPHIMFVPYLCGYLKLKERKIENFGGAMSWETCHEADYQ